MNVPEVSLAPDTRAGVGIQCTVGYSQGFATIPDYFGANLRDVLQLAKDQVADPAPKVCDRSVIEYFRHRCSILAAVCS